MIDRTFEEYKALFDEHLLDFIPDIDSKSITLYDSMKYSLSAGGKRLRPVLLMAACALHKPSGSQKIFLARVWITTRVIMYKNDRRCTLLYSGTKHFARMNYRAV